MEAAREVSDYWEWFELSLANGWTDGLPLAPPTVERVDAIVDRLGLPAAEVIGAVPPRMGVATVQEVAIQCAAAGCVPETAPVVLAALRAMLEPDFNLRGVQATTNPCTPLVIVSGPAVAERGFNGSYGCMAGGSHANASVGRAIRLILWTVGGGVPGVTDMTPIGWPGKYLACVAENAEANPWDSFGQAAGLAPEASAVSVFACSCVQPLHAAGSADRILRVLAMSLPVPGVNMFFGAGQFLLTFAPRTAATLAAAGYDRPAIQQWIFDHARFHLGTLRRSGVLEPGDGAQQYWGHVEPEVLGVAELPDVSKMPDETWLPMVHSPRDIHILVAGGGSGRWMAFSPGWGSYGGLLRTREIESA